MSAGRVAYWFVAGALIGFGCISILSIGLPFLLLGVLLLVIGVMRLGTPGLWAALAGFGIVPAAILLWDLLSTPWACSMPGGAAPRESVDYFTCVETPFGLLTTYHVMAAGFALIAVAGLLWPHMRRLSRNR